ncbi:MAG: hypothetical protein ACLP7P_08150 [Rhodomicrobium sp.]
MTAANYSTGPSIIATASAARPEAIQGQHMPLWIATVPMAPRDDAGKVSEPEIRAPILSLP